MKEKLEKRLFALEDEFKKGQEMLIDTVNKQKELEKQLLRINGAIAILSELLKDNDDKEV